MLPRRINLFQWINSTFLNIEQKRDLDAQPWVPNAILDALG